MELNITSALQRTFTLHLQEHLLHDMSNIYRYNYTLTSYVPRYMFTPHRTCTNISRYMYTGCVQHFLVWYLIFPWYDLFLVSQLWFWALELKHHKFKSHQLLMENFLIYSYKINSQRREDMTSRRSDNLYVLITFQEQESWMQVTRIALWTKSDGRKVFSTKLKPSG